MKREDVIREQLQQLGVYDPAFDSEIHILAGMERDLRAAQKAWKDALAEGAPNKFLTEGWPIIERLRKDILSHYDALGLTPKGMKRLKAASTGEAGPADPQNAAPGFTSVMDRLSALAAQNAAGA